MSGKRLGILLLVVLAVAVAGCANDAYAPETTGRPTGDFAGKSITVFAASSLTDAFTDLGQRFTQDTGAGVTFNFGGSSDLRAQLQQGAPADAFASADTKQMGLAKDSGAVDSDGTIFARNNLVVIIPRENRAGIATLQDLAHLDVKIAMADETVPVGKYARQFLFNAATDPTFDANYDDNVLANVVTNSSNVKEVVAAVQLDEVDAGIVYKTDVTVDIAADVTTIEIPDELNVIATYPIALTTNGQRQTRDAANAFIEYLLSSTGQAALAFHGFLEVQ